MQWQRRWSGKEKFYKRLEDEGRLVEQDRRPDLGQARAVYGAYLELSTERPVGMGIGSIPISKIWQYMDRFNLPDWWEPALLQIDAAVVAEANREAKKDGYKAPKHQDGQQRGDEHRAVRAG